MQPKGCIFGKIWLICTNNFELIYLTNIVEFYTINI